jgi:hypothetical protein
VLTLRGRDRGRVPVYFELGEVTSGDEPAKFSEADQRLVIEGGEDGDEGKGALGGLETWMLERTRVSRCWKLRRWAYVYSRSTLSPPPRPLTHLASLSPSRLLLPLQLLVLGAALNSMQYL